MAEIAIGDYRGYEVVSEDGDKIGTIEDMFVDRATERPEWALVNTGLFGLDQTLVPFVGASEEEPNRIRVPYSKATVKDAPRLDRAGDLTERDEADLNEYYGLGAPETGAGDSRAAAREQDLGQREPGLESGEREVQERERRAAELELRERELQEREQRAAEVELRERELQEREQRAAEVERRERELQGRERELEERERELQEDESRQPELDERQAPLGGADTARGRGEREAAGTPPSAATSAPSEDRQRMGGKMGREEGLGAKIERALSPPDERRERPPTRAGGRLRRLGS